MFLAAATVLLLSQTTSLDPNLLPIGRSGTAVVAPGQLWDLRTNREAKIEDVVTAAKGKRFVFLGENHATTLHQQMEADVLDALSSAGRKVSVGVEMYTRPKQDVLDQWSAGSLSEEQFLTDSDWKGQWGFDYSFYRPVFEIVRKDHLSLVALNVPRDWVRSVGKSGFAGLPTSAKLQLPSELYLGNTQHRSIFDAMMGGHPMGSVSMDNMYAAQVLWDEGMADTAIKYTELQPKTGDPVFVVISGSGHAMYGQGINYRIARRKAGAGLTLVMLQSDAPAKVSRGIADFVYVTKPVAAAN